MPSACLLAFTTITAAFQRMNARMRRSRSSSPGKNGSCSGGIVLMYGVDTVAGTPTCSSRARSRSFDMRKRARVLPWASTTESSESSHSWVSPGSMSGSWCVKPSMIMGPSSRQNPALAPTWARARGSDRRAARFASPPSAGHHRLVPPAPTIVYTDGACFGNPGPGGWAWAVPDGPFASGAEAHTTNQRMEITAAAKAVEALPGPLEIVSDSTYVVNCFKQRWGEGWHKRGWKNSKKEPVANRDLWEPFIARVLERGDVTFRWVKGHGGDPWNDLVDRLAVEAADRQEGRSGDAPPTDVGPADQRGRGAPSATKGAAKGGALDDQLPAGWRVAVFGHRPPDLGGYDENPVAAAVRRRIAEILAAERELHDDLIVLTGLRLGAEMLGAEAARLAGVPYVAVLP